MGTVRSTSEGGCEDPVKHHLEAPDLTHVGLRKQRQQVVKSRALESADCSKS